MREFKNQEKYNAVIKVLSGNWSIWQVSKDLGVGDGVVNGWVEKFGEEAPKVFEPKRRRRKPLCGDFPGPDNKCDRLLKQVD